MRRLTIALLATCLLGFAGSSPVVSEALTLPPVGVGGRVELPAHGLALTFPPEWVWVRLGQSSLDAGAFVDTLEAVMDPDDAAGYVSLAESLGDMDEFEFPLIALRGDVRGDIVPWERFAMRRVPLPEGGTDAPLDDFVSVFVAELEAHGFQEIAITGVTLPAGEAARVDHGRSPVDPGEFSHYILVADGILYHLEFSGFDRLSEEWLSIAETFEFLPADEE